MRSYSRATLVLVFVASSVAAAQSGGLAPKAVSSTWRIVRDARGDEIRRELTNRTFAFGFRYIQGEPTDLLFLQEVRTVEKVSEEGDNGRIHLEAWASVRPDTGYRRRLWATDVVGAAARLLEDYYETTEFGCCGTFDTRTFLSLQSGRPIASFTTGPISVRGGAVGEPSSHRPISVIYRSSMGTQPVGRGRTDTLAFGEILLLEGDDVLSRVILRATKRKADPMASVEFAFQTGRDSVSEGGIYLSAGARPAAHVYSDSWTPIVIPLIGRAFSLTGATIPAEVRAELVRNH